MYVYFIVCYSLGVLQLCSSYFHLISKYNHRLAGETQEQKFPKNIKIIFPNVNKDTMLHNFFLSKIKEFYLQRY